MSAHAMLHQKDNCVRSLERKSKNVPERTGKEVTVKQVKCPKCGHINTTDCQTECPKCSIIGLTQLKTEVQSLQQVTLLDT